MIQVEKNLTTRPGNLNFVFIDLFRSFTKQHAVANKSKNKQVSDLVEMGFDSDIAYIALLKCDFKKQTAIQDILEKDIYQQN